MIDQKLAVALLVSVSLAKDVSGIPVTESPKSQSSSPTRTNAPKMNADLYSSLMAYFQQQKDFAKSEIQQFESKIIQYQSKIDNSGSGSGSREPRITDAPLIPDGGFKVDPVQESKVNDYLDEFQSKLNFFNQEYQSFKSAHPRETEIEKSGHVDEIRDIISKIEDHKSGNDTLPVDSRAIVMAFGSQDQKNKVVKSEMKDADVKKARINATFQNKTITDPMTSKDSKNGFSVIKADKSKFIEKEQHVIDAHVQQFESQVSKMEKHVDASKLQQQLQKAAELLDAHPLRTRTHVNQRKVVLNAQGLNSTSGFVFNLQGAPFIRAGHWNASSDGFSGDSFKVSFLRVAEVPVGSTVDKAISSIKLTGQDWSPIEFKEIVADDGTTVQHYSSDLTVKNTTITLSAMISNKLVQATENNQTAVLTPFRLKYAIEINGYNYQSDQSELYIVKSVDTASFEGQTSDSIGTGNGSKLQWSLNANVDNEIKNITASVIKTGTINQSDLDQSEDFDVNVNEQSKWMAFNLGRGANVLWDPSTNLN
eukprot:NODE_311_length_10039_cov_0.864487.p1 type:complete len:537 gc:universal NODE_311_length_10039_cov_0.864487:2298-3908(+)